MKKRMLKGMLAGLAVTAMLAGCGKAGSEGAAGQPSAQEQQEEAGESGGYDPASFQVADVYIAPEQEPKTDISGCDTFTQIVDRLPDGKAYANATIGETDVLLVAESSFEWEEGKPVATDAEIFFYKDDKPAYVGTVAAGGTAYPLAVKDGNLYVGGNPFMSTYLVDNGSLIGTEEAYRSYDEDGNEHYYYKTCNSQFEDYDEATAKQRFLDLLAAQQEAELITFQPVGGAPAAGAATDGEAASDTDSATDGEAASDTQSGEN